MNWPSVVFAGLVALGFAAKLPAQDAKSTKLSTAINEPGFQQWTKGVAALPPQDQVKAVAKKLQELNPGFDGTPMPTVEGGVVVEITLSLNNLSDISPLRAWTRLKQLHFTGNLLTVPMPDISLLEGKPRTILFLHSMQVSDLSPLKGMPVQILYFDKTNVSDLSPLAEMPLTMLSFSGSKNVSDLSPLKGLPLRFLDCSGTSVSDLSPLDKCTALASLHISNTKVAPADVAAFRETHPNCRIAWDDPANVIMPAPPRLPTPGDVQSLFVLLDELGRGSVKDARFVDLTFASSDDGERIWTRRDVWLLEDKPDSITVLQNDLVPWTYSKTRPSVTPDYWYPRVVTFIQFKDADFEARCKELAELRKAVEQQQIHVQAILPNPFHGPSFRTLFAHAAWKRGFAQTSEIIIAADREHFQKHGDSVLEDLAASHFRRGISLLTYADRKDVLVHLHLASKLFRNGTQAAKVDDLIDRLEKVIAQQGQATKVEDDRKLDNRQRAELYVAQLVNLSCRQSLPTPFSPYLAIVDGMTDEHPPTVKLRQLGMDAVPVLVKALEDDTPTRTIYSPSGQIQDVTSQVWRVSDFAWILLRDITKRAFGGPSMVSIDESGNQPVVLFVLGMTHPARKQAIIKEAQAWYADVKDKNLSEDDRMLGFFDSLRFEDWITAGNYFLKKKDERAVPRLIEKIKPFPTDQIGELCELVSEFGDQRAKPAILDYRDSARYYEAKLSAAIALWNLGDPSEIPAVIEHARSKEPGGLGKTVYFLMRTRKQEGMDCLKSLVTDAYAHKASDAMWSIFSSVLRDFGNERRESAGSVELASVLVAAMACRTTTGEKITKTDGISLIAGGKGRVGVQLRIKDFGAATLVLLRDGDSGTRDVRFHSLRFCSFDRKVFDLLEPDEAKRDIQIKALTDWFEEHKDRLVWDAEKKRLAIKPE